MTESRTGDELLENETYISTRDDIEIEVLTGLNDKSIYVKFSGFEDDEEIEEYAQQLADTLPLLLFETTEIH